MTTQDRILAHTSFSYDLPPKPDGVTIEGTHSYIIVNIADGQGHEMQLIMGSLMAHRFAIRLIESAATADKEADDFRREAAESTEIASWQDT